MGNKFSSGQSSTGSARTRTHERAGGKPLAMKVVLEILLPIRYKWKFIGIALGVEMSKLNCIEDQYSNKPKEALLKLVEEWLNIDPTWERLLEALRTEMVGEPRLADEVEEKYRQQASPDVPQIQSDAAQQAPRREHQLISTASHDQPASSQEVQPSQSVASKQAPPLLATTNGDGRPSTQEVQSSQPMPAGAVGTETTSETEGVVLFEYEKSQDDELDLQVGQVVLNVEQVEDGWCMGTLAGKRGMFPYNFVKLRPAQTTEGGGFPPPSHPPAAAPESIGKDEPILRGMDTKAKSQRAKVMFSYMAENTDELTLEPGQIVEKLSEEEDGWWRGSIAGRTGVFPSNFVEVIKEEVVAKVKLPRPPSPDHNKNRCHVPREMITGSVETTKYLESPVCQTYAFYLKHIYSRTHDNKWPQGIISSYFNLATVKKNSRITQDQADYFTRATLHDGIDEILSAKEPITMEDVLKPLEGQSKASCVLVEGPPGVGKSTFAWQLCQRWDKIPDLKKYSLVVLLRFRDKRVQDVKDIADLFFHENASVQQAVAKEVCDRIGEGLLLILDGFDEFPASLRKRSLLLDIIKGVRLPGCTVVVTSRPSATADLFESCRVDKHIEVLGFTQKEIEEYASTVFASEPQLLGDFHKYRKLNPAITSMMYIPLNTAIVADVFLSTGKPLSHTMTELYVEMSVIILKRYLKGIGSDELADKLPTKLEDLPSDIRSHLQKLGEMAFKGVVDQEVIFNELPTDCEHFGFMSASPELYISSKPAKSYNFLHRSFQEFFTAFHFTQLPPSEQKEIFHKYFKNEEEEEKKKWMPSLRSRGNKDEYFIDDRFKEVWRFVSGLTSFRDIGWEVVKTQSSIRQLVSYLYEAQDVATCDSVLRERHDRFKASSLFDCYAVGWCIAASECRLRLVFQFMASGAEVCEAFLSGVNSLKKVCGSVSKLDLLRTPIKEEAVVHLMELPRSILQQMSKLRVYSCQLNGSSMDKLADLIFHMVGLKKLDIYDNIVGERGLVKLFSSLSLLVCLEKLRMGCNSIGCADVNALSEVIRPDTGHLKTLSIWNEQSMSPESLQLLMEVLLSPSSLESLRIVDVDLSSARDSLAFLKENRNLTSIVVDDIGQALPSMLEALEENRSVETLKIVNLKSTDVAPLVKVLNTNNFIKTLQVDVNGSDDEICLKMCLDIIDTLQHNHTLKRLELSELYSGLRHLFTQTELDRMDSRVLLR